MSEEKMLEEFNKLAKEFGYDLTRGYSQEYSYQTTQNVWKLWQASAAHSAARIAELEGQVAMLREALNTAYSYPQVGGAYQPWMKQAEQALSATAQTAEEYRRRVQAEALDEAADVVESVPEHSTHKQAANALRGMAELLRINNELRNPVGQAEGKESK